MDYHKLLESARLDTFKWVLEKAKDEHSKELIEHVLFALQNCYYNKNRILDEFKRLESGIGLPTLQEQKIAVERLGLKPGQKFEIWVPLQIWSYILVFEFHALVTNLIRCCNYLAAIAYYLETGQKLWPGKKGQFPSIAWLAGELKKRVGKETLPPLQNMVLMHYQEWIYEEVARRNKFMHALFQRQISGEWFVRLRYTKEGGYVYESSIDVALDNIKFVQFSNRIIERLEGLIKEFFLNIPKSNPRVPTS